MEFTREDARLIVRTPAKLNLFLEVLSRRYDGYHEIETVMQTVSIFDELTFERREAGIEFLTRSADVPPDGTNLVVQAAEALREHTGKRLGAKITLVKEIPVGAGLGGGSSDAAAALVGLNRLWELDLPTGTLHEIAQRLGSDVPFFLYGGTALCRGRGELVTPLSGARTREYVVVVPALKVSTREVYEKLPPDLTKDSGRNRLHLAGITNGGRAEFARACFNRLESVTVSVHEPLKPLRQQMCESGLEAVTMTGSGSAFFGIAASGKEAGASVEKLTRMGVGRVFAARSTR